MPTLKYYDGSAYQQLPGMPGVTGPAGPTGPTGAQGPPAPGVTLNYVAVAWGPASPPVTGTQPLGLTVSLLANHSYLVTGYAIAQNVAASAAAARFCITTAAAAGVPGPNAGVWIDYSANLAGDMVAVNCYTKGTTASFVYQPLTDGNVTFWIYSTGTAGAFQFGANNCMISVADLTGTQGPIGATGATGPAGPAGGGSTIVSVRAWRQATYTIPTTNTAFVFDNEQWDTQNAYNNTTGVFTAPVAGKYRVSAQIVSLGAAAVGQCITAIIQKNGTQVAQQFSEFASGTSPAQSLFAQVIDTLDLAVNDTVTFASYMVSGAALGVNPATSNTYMSIDLLSGTGPVGPTGPTGPAYAVGQMYSLVYYQTIPAPTVASSPYIVTHNLGTTFPMVQLWDAVTMQQVQAQVTVVDANRVSVTVAQNMPNPVNVAIMGVAASPVPINPGDYATKAYVDLRTPSLPAPVTSGSGVQSFTDALGDVWVAANGVRSGNWYRARDVLHGFYYRTATFNTVTTSAAFGLNTGYTGTDLYGMYNPNSGYVTFPVAGVYRAELWMGASATATSQWLLAQFQNTGGGAMASGQFWASGTGFVVASVSIVRPVAANEQWVTCMGASAVLTGRNNADTTRFNFDYLGTG